MKSGAMREAKLRAYRELLVKSVEEGGSVAGAARILHTDTGSLYKAFKRLGLQVVTETTTRLAPKKAEAADAETVASGQGK